MSDRLREFVGRKLGSTLIEREIGRGAMGAVFLAHQVALDRKVAVKVMLPALVGDEMALQRFRREALAIARLKDNHIVQVFEAGIAEDGTFFLVMEFLEGGTLDALLAKQGYFQVLDAIDLIKQTAKGLYTAHSAGLTHRDIKPSNLMISPNKRLTITDFGLVRDQSQIRETKANAILGTPAYLAPEQASSCDPDPRSDIYALGIVFFELLTGKLPFTSTNMVEVLVMHLRNPLPDPRQHRPDIPESLVRVLNKMTEKAPTHRYADCAVLLQDLEAIEASLRQRASSPPSAMLSLPQRPTPQTPLPTASPSPHEATANSSPWMHPLPQSTSTSSIWGTPIPTAAQVSTQMLAVEAHLAQRLHIIQQSALPELVHEIPLGWWIIGRDGTRRQQQGAQDDHWAHIGAHLAAQASFLSTQGQQGAWHYTSLETTPTRMLLLPHPEGYGALLLRRSPMNAHSSASLAMLSPQALADPLALLHAQGVDTTLRVTPQGEMRDQRSMRPQLLPDLQRLLMPLLQSYASFHQTIPSAELAFDQSRIFLWSMRDTLGLAFTAAALPRSPVASCIQALLQHNTPAPTPSLWSAHTVSVPQTVLSAPTSSHHAPPKAVAASQPNLPASSSSPHLASVSVANASGWGDLSFQSLEPVHHPLPFETIEALQDLYARYVGPMAKVALKKTTQKMGFSRKAFPLEQTHQLLSLLAEQLDDEKRRQFLNEAKKLLPPTHA